LPLTGDRPPRRAARWRPLRHPRPPRLHSPRPRGPRRARTRSGRLR